MKKALFCTILLLLTAAMASAQSTKNTIENFDLIGTWAVNCREPPAPRNSHTVFSITSLGTVRLQNDFGDDYDDMVYDVVAATRIGPDQLALHQILVTDTRVVLDVTMLRNEDRIRIWSSHESGGTPLVVRGAFPGSGGEQTRWATRCNERRAEPPGSVPITFFAPAIGIDAAPQ